MPTATISVQYVDQPKPGKKQGKIKTTSGEYYGVDPTQLGQFSPGGTYNIEYDTHSFQGKEYKTFRRMDGALPLPAPVQSGRPAHTQSVEMFTMGVIGRCVQGSGTIPDLETLTRWVKTCRWAWTDGFASISKPDEESTYE